MGIRVIKGPTILLLSGEYFDLAEPEACAFQVSDIAHALGNICRFTGHTLPPSVKIADRRALAVEQRVCMGNGEDWGNGEPTDEDCALIRFLSPEDARAAFLARYHRIRCAL